MLFLAFFILSGGLFHTDYVLMPHVFINVFVLILMLGVINNILFLLLISASFPSAYLIGIYSESEIEDFSEKTGIWRIFNISLVLLEIALLTLLYWTGSQFYVIFGAALIVFNMIVGAFYTATKSDFGRMIGYEALFISASLILYLIYLLL